MDENLIAEIRQLLQNVVVPDLETLMLKLDAIQQQLALTQQSVLAEIASFRADLETVRAEMKALRAELRGQPELPINEEEAQTDPQRYLM